MRSYNYDNQITYRHPDVIACPKCGQEQSGLQSGQNRICDGCGYYLERRGDWLYVELAPELVDRAA